MQKVEIKNIKLYQSKEGGFYSLCQWVNIFKQGQFKDQYQRNIINRVLQLKNRDKWGEFWTDVIGAVKKDFEADVLIVVPGSSGEFSNLQKLLKSEHLIFTKPQISRKYQSTRKSDDINYPPELIKAKGLNGLSDKRVLLIDDVITTGATMRFWASYLKNYGIDPICLALGMAEKIESEVIKEIEVKAERAHGVIVMPKEAENEEKGEKDTFFTPKTHKKEQQQEAMLKALQATLGVISAACDLTGIARTTFYTWIKEDPEFKAAYEAMNNEALDFVESKLFERIRAGSDLLIKFFLSTKGKERGYVERHEVKNLDPITEVKVTIIPGKNRTDGNA
jgi:hypoxanthine phosphoribosyltransferase